jgi:cytosine deaminase
MGDLILRGGKPWGINTTADVVVRDGTIARIGGGVDAEAADVIDVSGRLLLPGLVEAHCHLDKTLMGQPWLPHSAGDSLAERIANDRVRRHELGLPSVENISALLRRMVAAGTSYVRTHTDIDPEIGVRGVGAVQAAAAELDGQVTVQQVAFPQHGILTLPGTAELMARALELGVECIGGIDPAGMDNDPVRHLDIVFDLAERYGSRVDIHLHDSGTLGIWELEQIIARTRATGLGGRVAVSHAYALGEAAPAVQDRVIESLAEAGVSIITGAVYDFPVPPVKKLRDANVRVACGHDGIRDLWGPYGSGDMLERAMHVAYRSMFRRDDDIELALVAATYGGAAVLGLESYGLAEGARANIVVVPAGSAAEAVVVHPERELVLQNGVVVAGSRMAARDISR